MHEEKWGWIIWSHYKQRKLKSTGVIRSLQKALANRRIIRITKNDLKVGPISLQTPAIFLWHIPPFAIWNIERVFNNPNSFQN